MKTYGKLELIGTDHDRTWRMSEVPPHVAIRLKHLFPRIEKANPGPFTFPDDDEHAADLDWFMVRYPMRMSSADQRHLERRKESFDAKQEEREHILLPDYKPPQRAGFRSGYGLRHYQGQAVELLASRKALLLGDEVGLGKTFTAAGACLLEGALPAVIVVDPHLQRQWHRVLENATELRIHAIKTTKPYTLPEADVYIFRYSNVIGWSDVLARMDVGLACWDEIQALRKGAETSKGAASRILSGRARYRLGLTATPIYNYGSEIYNVLQFLDADVLGNHEDFMREWTDFKGRMRDPQALGSYLREQHVFLRRTRADVGNELPAVNTIVETVDYDEKTVRSADDLARQLAIKAREGSFVERGHAVRELDALMRHRTGVAKAKNVAHYVRILVESGEPVVLAGWHRDCYDIWLDELADLQPAMYTGSETESQKNKAARRFIEGETDILIMSLRSGAGLDGLQDRCRTIVFGELDWSPGIHHQLIGRLDRDRSDGRHERVMAVYITTDAGSDPPMMETLGLKKFEATAIVDQKTALQASYSDEDALQKLIDRYLDQQQKEAA